MPPGVDAGDLPQPLLPPSSAPLEGWLAGVAEAVAEADAERQRRDGDESDRQSADDAAATAAGPLCRCFFAPLPPTPPLVGVLGVAPATGVESPAPSEDKDVGDDAFAAFAAATYVS